MTKEKYIDKNFRKSSLDRISVINSVLTEYSQDGYVLTVRQLFYQLVSRGHIANTQRSYKQISELLNKARLAGLVDWGMIVDRERKTIGNSHWVNPLEILKDAANSFRIDKWADQPNHVEVFVEKDALSGVLIPVCRELDIRFTAGKGYPSVSLLYEMADRLRDAALEGKDVFILHMADHDPSGIDMTRDLDDRLMTFLGGGFSVDRLALNIAQVRDMNPPPNPAKMTDTRYKDYAAQFGDLSWELDAIEPRQLGRLVREAVETFRVDDLWNEAVKSEKAMRQELNEFAENYGKE